ncbi:MAG: alpha-hydroxy-acid oxidizing protein [Nocardiopsaceae bacterium]|nr:alpha-hydroxy-acid oxidizing protein [Nocardiopsaceae bacterium]
MRLRDMRELVRLRPIDLDATRRRLAGCHDVSDLRRAARKRIPRPVFDYVDGGADEEVAMAANVAAFRAWRFQPRVLADVAAADASAPLFGATLPAPLVLAPTGYTMMMHPHGEAGVARAAARRGLPYTLSTMSTTGIEDVAAAVAGADATLWFQLYILRDRARQSGLVDRAAEAGFSALVVTVDTVVSGNRVRDARNGLTMPPSLTPGTVASVAARPGYWLRLLSGPPVGFANFPDEKQSTISASAMFFNPGIDWQDITELRKRWNGTLILKGPIGPADARRAVDAGVDAIQLSNHGGRQLDRCVAPADLIAPVREAVGPSVPLLVDSGIRHGADIAVALALGADAAAIGRAYMYGLMAGGEAGVDHALSILTREFRTTMRLLGVTSVADLRKRGSELITR